MAEPSASGEPEAEPVPGVAAGLRLNTTDHVKGHTLAGLSQDQLRERCLVGFCFSPILNSDIGFNEVYCRVPYCICKWVMFCQEDRDPEHPLLRWICWVCGEWVASTETWRDIGREHVGHDCRPGSSEVSIFARMTTSRRTSSRRTSSRILSRDMSLVQRLWPY